MYLYDGLYSPRRQPIMQTKNKENEKMHLRLKHINNETLCQKKFRLSHWQSYQQNEPTYGLQTHCTPLSYINMTNHELENTETMM